MPAAKLDGNQNFGGTCRPAYLNSGRTVTAVTCRSPESGNVTLGLIDKSADLFNSGLHCFGPIYFWPRLLHLRPTVTGQDLNPQA